MIRSEWKLDGNTFQIEVEIPGNTTATITLPQGKITSVNMNAKKVNINNFPNTNNKETSVIPIGSGVYQISLTLEN